jgi:hypothetical protein
MTILVATGNAAEPAPSGGFLSTISGEVVHANTVELPRITLSDVVAFPVMTNQVLRLSDARARAYGGVATGTVTIDLADPKAQRITTQLVLTDIDLAQLITAFNPASTGIAGKMNGTLELTIPVERPDLMTGRGEVTVRDATLVEVSWFSNLLMGELGKGRGQDSATAQFEIGNGQWQVNNLLVQFSNAQVQMQGTVTFEGEMNMQVSPRFGSFLGLVPLIGRLFDSATGAITSRVVRGVLRGPMAKPVWVYKPFGE